MTVRQYHAWSEQVRRRNEYEKARPHANPLRQPKSAFRAALARPQRPDVAPRLNVRR